MRFWSRDCELCFSSIEHTWLNITSFGLFVGVQGGGEITEWAFVQKYASMLTTEGRP